MSQQLLKGKVTIAEATIQARCESLFFHYIAPQAGILEHMPRCIVELG